MSVRGGDRVKFVKCSDDQVQYNKCNDPRGVLTVGTTYSVSYIKEYAWHTKIKVSGVDGEFPSVCFEVVE